MMVNAQGNLDQKHFLGNGKKDMPQEARPLEKENQVSHLRGRDEDKVTEMVNG